jgi:hypothetical protein
MPGLLAANDVELVERVHERFQEARSSSAVQGDSEVGGISQSIACMSALLFGPGIRFAALLDKSHPLMQDLPNDTAQAMSHGPDGGLVAEAR